MRIIQTEISRREVVEFYVNYDSRKKGKVAQADLCQWNWESANEVDVRLHEQGMKDGALSAYRTWWFVEISIEDLLECAIERRIFPSRSQVLSQLCISGDLERWQPNRATNWNEPLQNGELFPRDWAMILRPSTCTETPARWYIEDGSGRALSITQRILRNAETWRTAYAFLGVVPDETSKFMQTRPELLGKRT